MEHESDPVAMGACALAVRLAQGGLSAEALVETCLARIAAREPEVRAWAWCDAEAARAQARALDARRAAGRAVGPLHGLPVALKDIIDTRGIPTENGCALDAGRVPVADAAIVARLLAAGAIVMGKTVTTELAYLQPAATRNPHNPAHTPGGSSSGSAAAVGAGMVPLAIGTQTGGSVIRPASFCGVTGYKPSLGAIPRSGVLMQSPTLDTLGVFARAPEDAALLARALTGPDAGDPASAAVPVPDRGAAAGTAPILGFVRPPGWAEADAAMRAALEGLVADLGAQVHEVALPAEFEAAAEIRARINFAEMAQCYRRYAARMDLLGPRTCEALRDGAAILARDYLAALEARAAMCAALPAVFARCDAILCPAATGPAPHGLGSTGDSIFNGLWTLTGVPAVTIPAFTARGGLPMGVQLVGARGDDARLIRVAGWLWNRLEG